MDNSQRFVQRFRPRTNTFSLPSYFLEVNKAGLVGVQHESASVGAHRVLADGRLSVFKLLLHIFDDRLTVQAEESSADQLRVYGVSAHHLPADA